VTNLAVMDFDRGRRRFRLASVHPGHTLEEVLDNTGFTLDVPDRVPPTAIPDDETLGLLRGPVASSLREFYPEFAARIFPLSPQRQSA